MRILHITPQIEPELGGIATSTLRLVEGLSARGHQNLVVASHGLLNLPDESLEGDVPIHRLPFYSALMERNAGLVLECQQRMAALKRAFTHDVVHLHIGGPMAFLHLATARESTAPLVATVHDLPADVVKSPTLVAILETAARIAAVSEVRLQDLQRGVPAAASRFRCIYPSLPHPVSNGASVRTGSPLLLTGGRMVTEKGFDVALDALARVRRIRPDARMIITGDGPCRLELLEQCRSLELGDDAVHLTGRLMPHELVAWRRQAWITLVPTRGEESFGLVALEAMHASSTVVASRTGGLSEVVVDGETGLLVPPGDATTLADAILTLLSDEGKMHEMGRAGQHRAKTLFNWERHLDAYERLFVEARG